MVLAPRRSGRWSWAACSNGSRRSARAHRAGLRWLPPRCSMLDGFHAQMASRSDRRAEVRRRQALAADRRASTSQRNVLGRRELPRRREATAHAEARARKDDVGQRLPAPRRHRRRSRVSCCRARLRRMAAPTICSRCSAAPRPRSTASTSIASHRSPPTSDPPSTSSRVPLEGTPEGATSPGVLPLTRPQSSNSSKLTAYSQPNWAPTPPRPRSALRADHCQRTRGTRHGTRVMRCRVQGVCRRRPHATRSVIR